MTLRYSSTVRYLQIQIGFRPMLRGESKAPGVKLAPPFTDGLSFANAGMLSAANAARAATDDNKTFSIVLSPFSYLKLYVTS